MTGLSLTIAWVVWLGPNRVPHAWPSNTALSGYDNRASHHHQLSRVARNRDLHGLMSQPNITTSTIYSILECWQDHMKELPEHPDIVLSDGENEP
jgi:hypothetical protein